MPRARLTLVPLAVCLGCQGETTLVLPPADGAATAIIATGDRGFVVDLTATDMPIRLEIDREAQIAAAFYAASVDELTLPVGRVEPPDDESRAVPASYDRLLTTTFASGAALDWLEVDTLPASLATLRLSAFDVEACGTSGGCWSGGESMCRLDCEAMAPIPPNPPVIECPTDWSSSADGDTVRFCDPTLPPAPTCDDGQRATPDATCAAVGSPCPAGEWPTGIEAGGRDVYYVRMNATGDGTRSNPSGDLSLAVATATPGTTIAVAAGTYPSIDVRIDDVRIQGVCPTRTQIGSQASMTTAVTIRAADTRIADVRIASAGGGVSILPQATNAELSGVIVNAMEAPIDAAGNITIDDAWIGGGMQRAIYAGAAVTARDVAVTGGKFGVVCEAQGSLDFDRAVVEGTTDFAFYASDGCTATIANARVEDAGVAVVAVDPTTDVQLRSFVARGTGRTDSTAFARGFGIYVAAATMDITDAFIEKARGAAVIALEGANITAANLFVREVGLNASDNASAVLVEDGHVTIRGLGTAGLYRYGSNVKADGTLDVADAYYQVDANADVAVKTHGGATLSIARIVADGPFVASIDIDDGSHVDLVEDIDVRGSQLVGMNLTVSEGTRADRLRVRGTSRVGLEVQTFLNNSDQLLVGDVDISCDGKGGTGIVSSFASAFSIDRFRVEQCDVGAELGAPFFGAYRNGRIVDNKAALRVDPRVDIHTVTHDVTFDRNERFFEPFDEM